MYRPPIPICCIKGCKNIDILCHCKNCKLYYCYNHRQLIDSHEIVQSFSIYDNYWCCNLCCSKHFYVMCSKCEEMVINSIAKFNKNENQYYCKYPCYKYDAK